MKKLLLIAALMISASVSADVPVEHNLNDEQKVYICTGSSSKRYHSKKNCRGLSNCGGTIKELTIEQAEKQGRTPCKICCPQ
jgi:hypothetical protein